MFGDRVAAIVEDDRFSGGKDGVHRYYRQLVDAYEQAGAFQSRWIPELRRAVDDLTKGAPFEQ